MKNWLIKITANRETLSKYIFLILLIATIISAFFQKAVGALLWSGYLFIAELCRHSPYIAGALVLLLLWLAYRFFAGNWSIIEVVRGLDNRWSTSKCQFFLWTVVALFSYATIYAARLGAHKLLSGVSDSGPDIPSNLLLAMGISITSAVAAKGITVTQLNNADTTKDQIHPAQAQFSDLIRDDAGAIDLTKVQLLGWTIIAIGAYLTNVGRTVHLINGFTKLPDIDPALMVLMGLGHGAYLGKKLILTTTPAIYKVDPPAVQLGADITITGSSFGATQVGSIITLNGTPPEQPVVVKSWSDTSICFTVTSPPFSIGATAVAVTVDSEDSNRATLNVLKQASALGNGAQQIGSNTPYPTSVPVSQPNSVAASNGSLGAGGDHR